MSQLKGRLLQKAVLHSPGLILFHGPDAIQVIQECRKDEIELYGFDGFFIHNMNSKGEQAPSVQPSMEDSFDYTSQGVSILIPERYNHAIDFISQKSRCDMYYEVVTRQDYIVLH
jgi:hypothetical protein